MRNVTRALVPGCMALFLMLWASPLHAKDHELRRERGSSIWRSLIRQGARTEGRACSRSCTTSQP